MKNRLFLSFFLILVGGFWTEENLTVVDAKETQPPPILTYQPSHDVKNYLDLARDLHEMSHVLSKNDTKDHDFTKAYRIYSQGGYVASHVRVTLHTPLGRSLPSDTVLSAMNHEGHHVLATTSRFHDKGEQVIDLSYDTSVACYVGGLEHQTWDGCFRSPGHLSLADVTLSENDDQSFYFVHTDHWNNRTLQSLSTHAHKDFRYHNQYFGDFQAFHDYYGSAHYADHMVQAALNGTKYEFLHQHFNFSHFRERGRFARKAVTYLSVSMYMIRELNEAMYHCHPHDCHHGNCHALRSLDAAVALYTGALQKNVDDNQGNFVFSLANEMCQHFHTCSSGTNGTARINNKMMYEFNRLQTNLRQGRCSDAGHVKQNIVRHAYIPLFQGLIFSAFQKKKGDKHYPKEEGAVFAAATMPRMALCSQHRAREIHRHFIPGYHSSDDFDFEKILTILEQHYECMHLSCEDIGGIWDEDKQRYHEHAQPCINARDEPNTDTKSSNDTLNSDDKAPLGQIIGATVVSLVALGFCVIYCIRCFSQINKDTESGDGLMVSRKAKAELTSASSSSTTGSDNSLSDDTPIV